MSLYSSVVERQSCKLKICSSILHGGNFDVSFFRKISFKFYLQNRNFLKVLSEFTTIIMGQVPFLQAGAA